MSRLNRLGRALVLSVGGVSLLGAAVVSNGSESAFANEDIPDFEGIYIEFPFEEVEGDWWVPNYESDEQAPDGVTSALHSFYAAPDQQLLETFLEDDGDLAPVNLLYCWEGTCFGWVTDDTPRDFQIFATGSKWPEFERVCDPITGSAVDWVACAESVGCEGSADNGGESATVSCPEVVIGGEGATFTIDPTDYQVLGSNDGSPLTEPPPLDAEGTPRPVESTIEAQVGDSGVTQDDTGSPEREATELTDESIFGGLAPLGPPEQVIRQLAVGSAVAVVFIVVVLLPTQLINSVLEVHGPALSGRVRKMLTRRRDTARGTGTTVATRATKTLQAMVVFFLATLITGFAEPDFGINAMSLRLFLTGFTSFLVINFVAIVLVWLIYRRRAQVEMPHLEVHYSYLGVIAATVVVSRFLELEPVVVFGVVLVIESGRVVASAARQMTDLPGRLAYTSGLLTLGLGVLSYIGYSTTRAVAPGDGFIEVALSEFFAIVTIEALATLPVLLLPLTFLPGYDLYQWSRVRWFISFAASLGLFVGILIPLPDSWATAGVSIQVWTAVLVGYSLFAVALWAVFARRANKQSPDDSESSTEGGNEGGEQPDALVPSVVTDSRDNAVAAQESGKMTEKAHPGRRAHRPETPDA